MPEPSDKARAIARDIAALSLAQHRSGEADENPAGGDCEVCGDLTGMATMVYRLPEHNGVEAYPCDGRLCTACAYELAEHLSEWAEKERAHARACGATIPLPGDGADNG